MDEKQLQALANELAKNLKTPEDLSQFDRLLKKLSVEAALNADFLQQAIKLAEVFRGFEVFGQFVSQSLQLFFVHKLTCF